MDPSYSPRFGNDPQGPECKAAPAVERAGANQWAATGSMTKSIDKPRAKTRTKLTESLDLGCSYARFGPDQPLKLDCGQDLSPLQVAYQTYGTLNEDKSNAVMVCHALTGDQFVANTHPVTGKDGWWGLMVGPGRPVDTDRFFVICANVLGGCLGTTGPSSIDPDTGKPYGLTLPVITVSDMVRSQVMLLDHLEIPKLLCVTGGSMGGMQVLEWAAKYPDRVRTSAIPIATAAKALRPEHCLSRGRPPGDNG